MAKTPKGPLHITKVTVRNYKRIDFCEITPEESIIMLRGPNRSGKSSIHECMVAALAGKNYDVSVPIRSGEREEETVLELGDSTLASQYTVTVRHYLPDGETDPEKLKRTLKVERRIDEDTCVSVKGGAQKFLDSMLATVTHSPIELVREATTAEGARKLARAVMEACGLEDDYDDAIRFGTDCRSRIHTLRSELATLKCDLDLLPAEVQEMAADPEFNAGVSRDQCGDDAAKLGAARDGLIESQARAKLATETVIDAERRIHDAEAEIRVQEKLIGEETARLAAALTEIETKSDLSGDIVWFDQQTQMVADRRVAIAAAEDAKEKRGEADKVDALIAELKLRLDTELPGRLAKLFGETGIHQHVDGVALDADGMIVINGRPATMLSTSEAIQLVVAIATIKQPAIRVMWIDEADCLDEDTIKAIQRIANERDYQIWMTAVYADAAEVHEIRDGKVVRVIVK